jgi:hypothetical protein
VTTATRLLVDAVPYLGEGARRFTVTCWWSESQLDHRPDSVEVTDEQLIVLVLALHADDCGECDLEPLWRRVDPKLRAMAERALAPLAAAESRARRN